MKYIKVIDSIVREIIPEYDPNFPDIPVGERYPKEFINGLIKVPDDTVVSVGMLYNADGTFAYPKIVPDKPVIIDLDSEKSAKIIESKAKLAEWLEANPMQYKDCKYYSVTAEKQALLNSNLASYERATQAGITYPLRWNAHGEECTEWTYEALVGLSLAIAAYVAPKVTLQQSIEIEINACENAEQLDKVVIDYEG